MKSGRKRRRGGDSYFIVCTIFHYYDAVHARNFGRIFCGGPHITASDETGDRAPKFVGSREGAQGRNLELSTSLFKDGETAD